MIDTPIIDARATDGLLGALGEHLDAQGERYSLAIVGGSALLALKLVSRATKDIDVVALVEDDRLLSAQPLPPPLLKAAATVARDFGLAADWLNPGPTALLDLGLPQGFYDRAERRDYGPRLQILFASRIDQIHLKLYATVDQGAGKHLADLQALKPTRQELQDAAAWSRTHDPSDGYLSVLETVLRHLGAGDHGPATAS